MLSSFLTLILHCCLIIGKDSDKIGRRADYEERRNRRIERVIKNFLKKQKKGLINI